MGGGGKKGKKGPKKVDEATPKKDETLNLPFGTLSALLSMGIESPTIASQIQKTIEALESKRKYFVDNQVSPPSHSHSLSPSTDESLQRLELRKKKSRPSERRLRKPSPSPRLPPRLTERPLPPSSKLRTSQRSNRSSPSRKRRTRKSWRLEIAEVFIGIAWSAMSIATDLYVGLREKSRRRQARLFYFLLSLSFDFWNAVNVHARRTDGE